MLVLQVLLKKPLCVQVEKLEVSQDNPVYEVFKRLDDVVLDEILVLINTLWEEGVITVAWKHAVVERKPLNQAPIDQVLTSEMCKIMERMVTDHLL